ncbi:MAG: hypothetical protein AAFW00_22460 [Bacteroidota bacterium]
MAKTIISLILGISLLMFDLQAQSPGGGMTPPDFDAKKAAGIFQYDLDKVLKKLKVKETPDQQVVAEALATYNGKMAALSFAHAATFKELENAFDRNVQIAMQNRDRSQMSGVLSMIKEILPPIKRQVEAEERVLNEALAAVLSEKQNEKWIKYQRRKRSTSFDPSAR